jgi:hypothetical protein
MAQLESRPLVEAVYASPFSMEAFEDLEALVEKRQIVAE